MTIADLRCKFAEFEEDADTAILRECAADVEICELQKELDRVKQAQASSSSKFEEQAAKLVAAESTNRELQATITSMCKAGRKELQATVNVQHVRQLQDQVRQQKGQFDLLIKREQSTNAADVRRRAAEQPELEARVEQLETNVRSLEEGHAQSKMEIATLAEENEALKLVAQAILQVEEDARQRQKEDLRIGNELGDLQGRSGINNGDEDWSQSDGVNARLDAVLQARAERDLVSTCSPLQFLSHT